MRSLFNVITLALSMSTLSPVLFAKHIIDTAVSNATPVRMEAGECLVARNSSAANVPLRHARAASRLPSRLNVTP